MIINIIFYDQLLLLNGVNQSPDNILQVKCLTLTYKLTLLFKDINSVHIWSKRLRKHA